MNSNKSRKKVAKLQKQIASMVAAGQEKVDANDPGVLLALVKALNASNSVPNANVSAASAKATDVASALVQLKTIMKKTG